MRLAVQNVVFLNMIEKSSWHEGRCRLELCVSCHTIESKEMKDKPNLAQCPTCHRIGTPAQLKAAMKWDVSMPSFNDVVLPVVEPKDN